MSQRRLAGITPERAKERVMDAWVTVLALVRKHGAGFVVAAVKAALAGSDDKKEVGRLRDFWCAVREKTWEIRHQHGTEYRHCRLCGRWEAEGCAEHCVFHRYPRD